jgi:hypothetical protein
MQALTFRQVLAVCLKVRADTTFNLTIGALRSQIVLIMIASYIRVKKLPIKNKLKYYFKKKNVSFLKVNYYEVG